MKSYRRKDLNEAKIPNVPECWYKKITAEMIDEYWPLNYISDYFAEVLNGTTSLNEMRDNILSFVPEYEENKQHMNECDGAAGAAGAAVGGGEASSAPAGEGSGSTTTSGTSTADVLGHCDHEHGEGFFGPGCFHIPSRVVVPLYRWGCAYEGSKRKKNKKNKKPKKTPYEKDMKVVVSMFESDDSIDPVFVYGITPQQCMVLLDTVESTNPHYDRNQFTKYLTNASSTNYECVGCFDMRTKACLALAILANGVAKLNDCYICEVQSFQKGYGKWLVKQILKNNTNVWLMAQPGIDALLVFYRDPEFKLKEHVIEDSIYGMPTHFFYQESPIEEKLIAHIDSSYAKKL